MSDSAKRNPSIDIFRSVTMLLMVFVNDVDSVSGIPSFIRHAHPDSDSMGFADVIFPAFLFIVGLSLPFALQCRLDKGSSSWNLILHILWRSLALLVMGIFQVNMDVYNAETLSKSTWVILVTLSFFLVWLDYPPGMLRWKIYILKGLGVLILILMAGFFKAGEPGTEIWFRTYWWGILGIIGWSYLICSIVFILSKGNFGIQAATLLLFVIINIGVHTGIISGLPVIGNAAYCALTMAGVVTGLLREKLLAISKSSQPWIVIAGVGVFMLLFGFLIRPYAGGLSKVYATPSWTAICIGINLLVFEFLIFLIDVRNKESWFKGIAPAGTNALTCYLLPYFIYSIYTMAGFQYPEFFSNGTGGILRSFAVAFFVVWLTGKLKKLNLTLKL
jgi:heparan-alpha-glucosaminide N-acetyltransferase